MLVKLSELHRCTEYSRMIRNESFDIFEAKNMNSSAYEYGTVKFEISIFASWSSSVVQSIWLCCIMVVIMVVLRGDAFASVVKDKPEYQNMPYGYIVFTIAFTISKSISGQPWQPVRLQQWFIDTYNLIWINNNFVKYNLNQMFQMNGWADSV